MMGLMMVLLALIGLGYMLGKLTGRL